MFAIIKKLFQYLCFIVGISALALAQIETTSDCGMPKIGAMLANALSSKQIFANGQQSILSTQYGGQWMTTKDTINVLVLFVQFPDDQYDTTYSLWPKNQAPSFLKTYIDSLPSQQSTNGNLTHYFRQMSMNSLTLIGKTRSVITPHSRQWYFSNGFHRWKINTELLQLLDASTDLTEFDRYKRYGEYDVRRESDGKVDMIFMIYRNVAHDLGGSIRDSMEIRDFYGGEASLGYARNYYPYNEPTYFSVDSGARTIGSGHPVFGHIGSGTTSVIAGTGDGWFGNVPYRTQIHEFAHHWMTDGVDFGHNGGGFWGMLNDWAARFNSQSVSCPNSFERELLGWIAPDSIYQTTSNITLTDYITTGDAVKIKVPGSNPNEVFRLEYHLKTSSFDNPEMGDPNAKGLYIIHQTGMSDPKSQIRLIPGDGRWTWVADTVAHPTYYPAGLAVYEKTGIDRVNGSDDSREVSFSWVGAPPTPTVPNPSWIHILRDRSKDTKPILDQDPRIFRGDGNDAFTLTKNNIFSPWSNPNSQNAALQKTGFAIQILSENTQTGVMVLNIYYDSTSALSLPPSKPQDVQANISSTNQFTVTWATNIESDVLTGGGYNIYREMYYNTTTASSVKLNTSLLTSPNYTDGNNFTISNVPNGVDLYCRYRVEAVDNTGKASVKSEGGDVYLGKTISGTISGNTTWNGKYVITGNISINSGTTLTISSGSTIRLTLGSTLTANGNLQATSAVFLPVVGTSYGSWGSIVLNGSGASGSVLNYVNVQNGTEINVTNVPSFTINNSTMSNMVNGVNAYNSNGWVMNSTITNPQDHGIISNNSTIACYYNSLTKTNHTGAGILYSGGGGDYIFQNQISGFNWGVGSIYGSFPYFGHPLNTGVNNYIQNCLEGIRAYQYSGLYMGDDEPNNPFFGYSSFLNTNTYHATVYDYSEVYATYNYWGQYPVNSSKFSIYNGGTMDYSSALTEDPWMPSLASIIPTKEKIPAIIQLGQTEHPFKSAMKLKKQRKDIEALALLKDNVAKGEYVLSSLLAIASLHNDTLGSAIEEYLSSIPISKSALGTYLYGNLLSRRQRNNEAITAFSKIDKSPLSRAAKVSEFYVNLHNTKSVARAKEILDELIKTNEENDIAISLALHDYQKATSSSVKGNEPKNNEVINASNNVQNFPNPFNPTTTISYTIVEPNNVELKVYDYLGREVTTLVNEYKSLGEYKAQFNANNLASGVYFYTLKVGNAFYVKKMLYVK